MARDPGLNTVTTVASSGAVLTDVPERLDALSAPLVEELIAGGLALWPQGAAWGTPRGQAPGRDTVLARLTRVLLAGVVPVYGRVWQVTREAIAASADETLEAWETDYGLPGPCGPASASRAERLAALRVAVIAGGTITPGEFIRLALSYEFEIEIEEPAVFECGFSECGGEHATGDWRQEVYWLVRVRDVALYLFRVGEGELGHDPLFSFGDAETLLCILKRIAPAWTIPVIEIIEE